MGGVAAMSAQDQEVIKGFSGGMMVHSGYQYGCDNPFGLNISSPTFGIGGCAKLHFSEHFRAGFEHLHLAVCELQFQPVRPVLFRATHIRVCGFFLVNNFFLHSSCLF